MADDTDVPTNSDPHAMWKRVSAEIRRRVKPAQLKLWLSKLEPIEWSTERVVLADIAFRVEWLERHYTDVIGEACLAVLGYRPRVELRVRRGAEGVESAAVPEESSSLPVVQDHPAPARPRSEGGRGRKGPRPGSGPHARVGTVGAVARRAAAGARRVVADPWLPLNPGYRFENFVTGPANAVGYAAANAVASQPGRSHNPLFIHGSVGLGKTHLLQAIAHALRDQHPELTCLCVSCEGFINQFIEAVERKELDAFRQRYRTVDVLLVDDIRYLAGKEKTQDEFFHTFNALHQQGKQIVITSDAAPKELPGLDARIVSRFGWGIVAHVAPPDYDTRAAIVTKKASLIGLVLDGDVTSYVATHVTDNVRELEGAVNRLYAVATFDGRRMLDLARAQAALADLLSPAFTHGGLSRVGTDEIARAVARRLGLDPSELYARDRRAKLAFPRQLCMYLAEKVTSMSLREIGKQLGGRDHTTVLHAIGAIEKRMAADPPAGVLVRELVRELRGAT